MKNEKLLISLNEIIDMLMAQKERLESGKTMTMYIDTFYPSDMIDMVNVAVENIEEYEFNEVDKLKAIGAVCNSSVMGIDANSANNYDDICSLLEDELRSYRK